MRLSIFQWSSLKTRMTLFTLSVFLVGIWSLAFYASRMLRQDLEYLLGEQQFSTASLIAAQLNQELDERFRSLETVAGSVSPALLGKPAAVQALLEQRPLFLRAFNAGTFVTGTDGIVIASLPLSAERFGVNYMDRDFMVAVLKEGKSTIGRPVLGKKSLAPVIAQAVPIRDAQGKVIGSLVGATYLGAPSFLDKISENRYGRTGSYLLIAPQHRLFVTATDKSRIMQPVPAPGINAMHDKYMQGYEGYGVATNSRGVEELSAAKGIPLAGWYVVVVLPTAEAFAPIRTMQQRMLVATLFLTLLAGALVWWISSWILRRQLSPLLAATKSLDNMSEASQALLPLPLARPDEIGQLIAGFNRLLETLGQRETALRESEERFKALHEASFGGIVIHDQGIILDCNQGLSELTGYTSQELVGMNGLQLIAPEWSERVMRNIQSGLATAYEVEGLRKNGARYQLYIRGKNIPYKGRTVRVAEFWDITERKQAEEKLHLAASVFIHAREGIMITAADGSIIDVNDAFTSITGYERDEVLGKNPRLLNSGRHEKEFYATQWAELIEKGHWYGEVWNRHKNGDLFAVMETISTVRDIQGKTQHYVALFSDITSLKEYQKQLERIAHYDVLTALPNRALLADRLRQAMANAQRRGQRLAVAYLDLDGFKAINDKHGHEAGDQLLMTVATRMKQALREGDTLARLGGDEFVAVLLDLANVDTSATMLNRLLVAAAQPVHVDDLVLQVSASLGVTFYPQAEDVEADQLLRQSDQAMYQAKLTGKNRYQVFDDDLDRSVRGHHEGLEHIRRALIEREFVLHFQPKVNMRTGMVVGAEALIRWQHREKGLLPPVAFLPVIEDHPLAVELGQWVIDTALTQMGCWQAAGLNFPVSVNIGARQLQQADFVERLQVILAAHSQFKPGDLVLEVLESSAMEDLSDVSQVIEACREIGVGFALDDFGSGFSSLINLKRLPVTQLKIDQSIVRDILDDPDDLAILEGVLGLTTAFRLQVIAEGVETRDQQEMLLRLGCDLAQGFSIARPMPADELLKWAATWHPEPFWCKVPAIRRDDLPLLFAGTEHRAWIATMEKYLGNKRSAPPPLDHHQCRFGTWMDADGRARHGTQPAFQRIEPLHRQVHALSAELSDLKARGRSAEVLERLGELHTLRDELLAQLNLLVQDSGTAASPALRNYPARQEGQAP